MLKDMLRINMLEDASGWHLRWGAGNWMDGFHWCCVTLYSDMLQQQSSYFSNSLIQLWCQKIQLRSSFAVLSRMPCEWRGSENIIGKKFYLTYHWTFHSICQTITCLMRIHGWHQAEAFYFLNHHFSGQLQNTMSFKPLILLSKSAS